jgi:phosphoribosylformylglycinamidine synthase II
MAVPSNSLDFSQMSDEDISQTLSQNKIGLTVDEAKKIQEMLGRPPTLTEAIVWGIQGSEHCSYKSTRNHLKTLPTEAPNIMLGVGEDAGIVHFAKDKEGRSYGLIMAHESHNHPSQVVPYEGAATGVGGIVRDVLVMGGRAIATGDPLRFGDPNRPLTKLIADDVVAGIAGYSNPLGVPNIAGDTYFNASFNDNCLVNVVCLGAVREDEIIHSFAPKNALGYDLIIVGKPTDNSGMGGAAFSSMELDEDDKEANKGAVQEPNPFLERHLLESTYHLFEKLKKGGHLGKVGFKDMGAGGNICATVELVEPAGYGAEIDLTQIHTSIDGLHPSVIACAETQERVCWTVDPSLSQMILDHYNVEWDLPRASLGARASKVGKVTEGNYVVKYGDQVLIDAHPEDITKGVVYDRPYSEPVRNFSEPEFEMPRLETSDNVAPQAASQASQPTLPQIISSVLASENIASRLPIFERYDKIVQGQTIFQPGIADAGLIAPFRHREDAPEVHQVGAALSVDSNPRHGLLSPYWAAVNSVVESMRNVAAIGATPWACTDCLNYGNPEKPEQMWELVEGIRGIKESLEGIGHLDFDGPLPVVSGNVSLYNESKNGSVAPSAVIGMVGRIENHDKAITMQLKEAGNALYLIGDRKNELGASEYYKVLSETLDANGQPLIDPKKNLGANIPKPEWAQVRNEITLMTKAVDQALLASSHDISDGGLIVALVEMMAGGRGKGKLSATIDLSAIGNTAPKTSDNTASLRFDKKLFSETGGFLVEVKKGQEAAFIALAEKVGLNEQIFKLGETNSEENLTITDGEKSLTLNRKDLVHTWLTGLRDKLNS